MLTIAQLSRLQTFDYAFGPLKVMVVMSDTCTVMQNCLEIDEDEFPWISCIPCQPHVIPLLLKDIGKLMAED